MPKKKQKSKSSKISHPFCFCKSSPFVEVVEKALETPGICCPIVIRLVVVQVLKEANEKIREEYGYCLLDNHKERIGNFKIEPPGLFRGRGEHPKQGMLKKRIQPEDVIINCGKSVKQEGPNSMTTCHDAFFCSRALERLNHLFNIGYFWLFGLVYNRYST